MIREGKQSLEKTIQNAVSALELKSLHLFQRQGGEGLEAGAVAELNCEAEVVE